MSSTRWQKAVIEGLHIERGSADGGGYQLGDEFFETDTGLHYEIGVDLATGRFQWQLLGGSGGVGVVEGTLAARPAPNTVSQGTLYFATDLGILFVQAPDPVTGLPSWRVANGVLTGTIFARPLPTVPPVGTQYYATDEGLLYILAPDPLAANVVSWILLSDTANGDYVRFVDATNGSDTNAGLQAFDPLNPTNVNGPWKTLGPRFNQRRPVFNRRKNRLGFAPGPLSLGLFTPATYNWPTAGAVYRVSEQLGPFAEHEIWVGVQQTVQTVVTAAGASPAIVPTTGGLVPGALRGKQLLFPNPPINSQELIRDNDATTITLESFQPIMGAGVTLSVLDTGAVVLRFPNGGSFRGDGTTPNASIDLVALDVEIDGAGGFTGVDLDGCRVNTDRTTWRFPGTGWLRATNGGQIVTIGTAPADLRSLGVGAGAYVHSTGVAGGGFSVRGADSLISGAYVVDKTMFSAIGAFAAISLSFPDMRNSPVALFDLAEFSGTSQAAIRANYSGMLLNAQTTFPLEIFTYRATPALTLNSPVITGAINFFHAFTGNAFAGDVSSNAVDGIFLGQGSRIQLFGATSAVAPNARFGVSQEGGSYLEFSDASLPAPFNVANTITGTTAQVRLGGPTYGTNQTFAAAVAAVGTQQSLNDARGDVLALFDII